MYYLSYRHPFWEYGGVTGGHHALVELEACMARHVIDIRHIAPAALPAQISEVPSPLYLAADA